MKRYKDTKYLVTEDGKIWSECSKKFLIYWVINGYSIIRISLKNKPIHRMVAECYIPNPNNYPHVNHINNDRSDNRVENLEWCTRRMNEDHKIKQGRQCKGSTRPLAKLNEVDIIEIRRIYTNKEMKQKDIAIKFNVGRSLICQIIKRQIWRHI